VDSETRRTPAFLRRRAAAYQAWWEHMPVRFDPPTGPDLGIHRSLDVGALARIHLLDTRQYRTPLRCEDAIGQIGPRCDTSFDPETTFLGVSQEDWLAESVTGGDDRAWDVVGNQVTLHQWRFGPGRDAIFNLDQWDGYPRARERLTETLAAAAGDVVVLTGDVHSTWVSDVKADFDDESSERVGTEMICPGISSEGADIAVIEDAIRVNSPHVQYSEALHRGWLRHELTEDTWATEIRHVDDANRRGTPVRTSAEFVIERGRAVAEA
jgi:alkaline phosphatase D